MTADYFKNNLIALDFARAIAPCLKQLADPLFLNTPITNFSYLRFNSDGRVINIATDVSWIEHRFTENVKYQILFAEQLGNNELDKPYIYLWPNKVNSKVLGALHTYGIWNGCNIYIPQRDKIEVYSFSNRSEDIDIQNFYINNFHFLTRFILYVNIKIKHFLTAEKNNIYVNTDLVLPNCNKEDNNRKKDLFFLKKVNFDEKITLTSKEIQCCYYLNEGLTLKGIANRMLLSSRTIETHIKNVKLKTQCFSTALLIEYIRQKKWIFDSMEATF